MNLDKIKQVANKKNQENDHKDSDIKIIKEIIDRFPKENSIVKEALDRIVIDYSKSVKPNWSDGFRFYIVCEDNKEDEPDWKVSYGETNNCWYIIDESGIRQICKYKSIGLFDDDSKSLSNIVAIKTTNFIPLTKPLHTSDRHELRKYLDAVLESKRNEYISHILGDFDNENGLLKPFVKDHTVIDHETETYTRYHDFKGYTYRIVLYTEDSANGKYHVVHKDFDKSFDWTTKRDFEKLYRKHIIEGLKNADLNKGMENLLENIFKEREVGEELSIKLWFSFSEKMYELVDARPNIDVRPTQVSLYGEDYYPSKYYHTVTEINSDKALPVSLPDRFWKYREEGHGCTDLSRCSNFYLNNVTPNDIFDDWDFPKELHSTLVEKLKETGLTIVSTNEFEDEDWIFYRITVKNPLLEDGKEASKEPAA